MPPPVDAADRSDDEGDDVPVLPAGIEGVPEEDLERERRALREARAKKREADLLARQRVVQSFNAAMRCECAWNGKGIHSGSGSSQTVVLLDFAADLARPGSDPPCIDRKFDADGMHLNANVMALLQRELETMGV